MRVDTDPISFERFIQINLYTRSKILKAHSISSHSRQATEYRSVFAHHSGIELINRALDDEMNQIRRLKSPCFHA